jgi:TonB family protein
MRMNAARTSGPVVFACLCLLGVLAAQVPSSSPTPLASNPQPVYPPSAIQDAAIGRVEVEIAVGADGKVRSSRIVRVAPVKCGFEHAAEDAVRRWAFEPARVGGSAVEGTYRQVFEFGRGQLFSLAGWVPQANPSVSFAEGGALMRLGRASGWVHTRRFFSEYSLRVALRLANPGTRAALLLHGLLERDLRRTGYRVNLSENADGPDAIARITGRDVPVEELTFNPAGARATRGPGEWQQLDVLSAEGRVETRLNGALVSAIADRRFTGLIGFEVSAGTLEVRGAEIVRRDTFLGGDFSIAAERPKGPGAPVPKLVREVKPVYSPQAMRDIRQGEVFVDAIIDATGKVLEPRISRSLDIDLDQAAVAALRQWQFEPAVRDGRPFATVIQVQMTFALR